MSQPSSQPRKNIITSAGHVILPRQHYATWLTSPSPINIDMSSS